MTDSHNTPEHDEELTDAEIYLGRSATMNGLTRSPEKEAAVRGLLMLLVQHDNFLTGNEQAFPADVFAKRKQSNIRIERDLSTLLEGNGVDTDILRTSLRKLTKWIADAPHQRQPSSPEGEPEFVQKLLAAIDVAKTSRAFKSGSLGR